jgi:hypothetical protein
LEFVAFLIRNAIQSEGIPFSTILGRILRFRFPRGKPDFEVQGDRTPREIIQFEDEEALRALELN